MAKLYVIGTGETMLEAQSRVDSAAGAPLTDRGIRDVEALSRQLAREGIGAVYASSGEAERQTAKLLGKALGVKVRVDAELREIDYGLWQGLTHKEIRRRQPKVYKQWTEVPTTVCPPGGETLAEAEQRLRKALLNITKRHKNEAPLLVLRPIVLGLMRCILERRAPETLWDQAKAAFEWSSYPMDAC